MFAVIVCIFSCPGSSVPAPGCRCQWHFRIWTERVNFETCDSSDIWSKRPKKNLICQGRFACFIVSMFDCPWFNLFAVGGTFSSLLLRHRWGELRKVFKVPLLPACWLGGEMSVSVKLCNGLTMRRVIVSVQRWKCIRQPSISIQFKINPAGEGGGEFKPRPFHKGKFCKHVLSWFSAKNLNLAAPFQSNENLFWEISIVREKGASGLVTCKSLKCEMWIRQGAS